MEISIIMPVYNEKSFLSHSIESVLNQTFQDWELIIVDDGSSKDIYANCESYLKQDRRICFHRQKHAGQATARNYGLSLAKGKYIAFLDADDCMHPLLLEQLYKDIQSTGLRMAVCDFTSDELSFKKVPYEMRTPDIWDVSKDSIDVKAAIKKDNVYLWNKLFEKKLFEDVKFADGRFYEDTAIMHRLFQNAGRISYNTNILYFYYQNPQGTVHTFDEKKIMDCLWAHRQRIHFYCSRSYLNDLKHVAHTFLYIAYDLYAEGVEKCDTNKIYLRKKIRWYVKKVFQKYNLEEHFPFHGKLRLHIFLYYPRLFEAGLYFRQKVKRINRLWTCLHSK